MILIVGKEQYFMMRRKSHYSLIEMIISRKRQENEAYLPECVDPRIKFGGVNVKF